MIQADDSTTNSDIRFLQQTVEECYAAVQRLLMPSDTSALIQFYKVTRPQAIGLLQYHQRQVALLLRAADEKMLQDILAAERLRLVQFLHTHRGWFRYYRGQYTYLDTLCFSGTPTPMMPSIQTASDLFARFFGTEKLLEWISEKSSPVTGTRKPNALLWTASKAAMVELIYALYASNVLQAAPLDIKTVTIAFEQLFGVTIGNIYKVYEEIRLRKKVRTPFLDALKRGLEQKLAYDDEHTN